MIRPDPLAAHDVPPAVSRVDGEVVILGQGVGVAYTPAAARALAAALLEASNREDATA